MWLFSSKHQRAPPPSLTNAFLVRSVVGSADDAPFAVYEDRHDAKVEATRRKYVTGGNEHEIVEVVLVRSSSSSSSNKKKKSGASTAVAAASAYVDFADLPEHVQADVKRHQELVAAKAEARLARLKRVADEVRAPWEALLRLQSGVERRCDAAKDAVLRGYAKDKSVTMARVREVTESNAEKVELARVEARRKGAELVTDALLKLSIVVDDGDDSSVVVIGLDELIVEGLLVKDL